MSQLSDNHLWLSGIELFNGGEFFECHEVLEDLWNEQLEPEKQLTQGILQIAVGYYHLGRDNRVGALKLFTRGLTRIEPFLPSYAGLDLQQVADRVAASIDAIEQQQRKVPGPPQIRKHAQD